MFHYNLREFECNQCGKSFFYQNTLDQHQRGEDEPCKGVKPHVHWQKRIINEPAPKILKISTQFSAENKNDMPKESIRKKSTVKSKKNIPRIRKIIEGTDKVDDETNLIEYDFIEPT